MWGNNSNFTLGQADTKSRENPELLETLWSLKCSIKQVAVSKFHSVFLSEDGSIFTCGQGRGGRLGHGNEQTILCPKQVEALKGIFCTAISTAHDHTLVLDQMGQVYSFGLNTYHQLGHYPVPRQSLIPKMITSKSLKGKFIIGVAAARFHSAIYTRQELFMFGLNAGQLGHSQGDDLQSIPRVSMLSNTEMDISHVAVSDGATCCVLVNGDLYILQDYSCKKIAKKMTNIKKLVMSGGELETRLLVDLQNKDPDELCIAALKDNGIVQCWKNGHQSFKDCAWAGRRKDSWKAIDISLGKHMLIATDEGVVFQGFFRGNQTPTKHGQDLKSTQNKPVVNSSFSLAALAASFKKRKEEQQEIMLQRVPLLYRGYQVACDSKSKTFAVIQNDPMIGLKRFPTISGGTLEQDLENLLNEADLVDGIADVEVKAKDTSIAAHYFILESRLPQHDLEAMSHFDAASAKAILDLRNEKGDSVKKWLLHVYTGKTSMLLENFCGSHGKSNGMRGKINGHTNDKTDVIEAMKQFSLRDLESPDCMDSRTIFDDSGKLAENIARPSSKRGSKNRKKREASKTEPTKRKTKTSASQEIARKGFPLWKEKVDLSDVIIESEDGIQFNCHRCILYSRLDYFRGMLGSPWMEANWTDDSIKMQIPEKILKIILEFIYTDEIHSLKDCRNISLLCDIIIYADQLLITRLKEICEDSLSKLISLKNALEMLEFSCTYNAEQLKVTCCELISINLTYYLEIRALESFSPEVLRELSDVYKELIPSMAYRKITPSTFHLEVDETLRSWHPAALEAASNGGRGHTAEQLKDTVFEDAAHPSCSPNEKANSSAKKRRRRRRSGSVKDGSFSEDAVVGDAVSDVTTVMSPGKETGPSKPGAKEPQEQRDACDEKVATPNTDGCPAERMENQVASPVDNTKTASRTRIRSFREIMEEEQNQGKPIMERKRNVEVPPSKESQSNLESFEQKLMNPAIKWGSKKKTSQKQRKHNSQSESSLSHLDNATTNPSIQPSVAKETSCPWAKHAGQQSPAVKAFKDVVGEELQKNNHEQRLQEKPGKCLENGARNRLGWKENLSSNGEGNVVSSEGIWSKNPLAKSPPCSSISLSAIMELQQEEKETSAKILQKPLKIIQMEEKAIEELLLHYKAKDNPSEYITVERIKTAISTPIWKTDDRS